MQSTAHRKDDKRTNHKILIAEAEVLVEVALAKTRDLMVLATTATNLAIELLNVSPKKMMKKEGFLDKKCLSLTPLRRTPSKSMPWISLNI